MHQQPSGQYSLARLSIAATHDGPFHADDVLAGGILLAGNPGLSFVRTRDAARLATADLRFDVGGVYNLAGRTFDHHFADQPIRPDGTPYSSAGLIWRDLGGELLSRLGSPAAGGDSLHAAFDRLVVTPVDAVDNGVTGTPFDPLLPSLTSEIPPWNETPADPARAQAALNDAYGRQVAMVAARLRAMVEMHRARAAADTSVAAFRAGVVADGDAGRARLEISKAAVVPALREAVAVHGGRSAPLELANPAMPWGSAIHQIEEELGVRVDQVLFRALDGTWIVQSVAVKPRSFESRIPFPLEWRGLSGVVLCRVSGLAEAVFCHPAGFCAGFSTREGALRGAEIARGTSP